MLHQSLADALHHTAVHLAFDDHRIDQCAEIVDAGIFHDLDKAGLRIDLDFGDVATIRIGRSAGPIADMHHIKRLRNIGRRLEASVKFLRELHDRDRAIRSDDNEAPVFERDIRRCRFENVSGKLLAVVDDLGRAFDNRGAAVHQRLRTAGAAADRINPVAISLNHIYFFERHTEPLAQNLGEWRGMAHAEIERAGGERDGAVGIESDSRQLLHRPRGHFQIIRHPQAAQLAALAAFALAPRKTFAVGEFERALSQHDEVAAIVIGGGGRLQRQFLWTNLVTPPQRDTIDAHFGGGGID